MRKRSGSLINKRFSAISLLGILIISSVSFAQINTTDRESIDGFGQNTNKVRGVSGVVGTQDGSTGNGSSALLDTIKNTINWILGMLSLIALAVLLWGGFQMIIAAGDENKHKKGYTILKQAAIGLIFIGLAWLFISLIFWIIKQMSKGTVT